MKISVQGHRGSRGTLPENTIPAFIAAISAGADFVELDIGVSSDRRLVINHDAFLNPVIHAWRGGEAILPESPIHSYTFEKLREIDAGSQKNPEFPRQKKIAGLELPALEELFAAVKALNHPNAAKVIFNIEIKSIPVGDGWLQPKPKEFAKLALASVRQHGMEKRVVLQSFDHRVLREIRKLDRKIFLSALLADNAIDYVALAKALRVQAVSAHMHWITRADVLALKRKKIQIFVWTANELRDWERLVRLKVDSIITDYPEDLLNFLRGRKLHD